MIPAFDNDDTPRRGAADVEAPFEPDFALYIHWPFCGSKCPYCDFNSRASGSVDHSMWRQAYIADIQRQAEKLDVQPRVLTSVYFGGGTPSLMAPETVAAIVEQAASLWPLAEDVEISMEANPATVNRARLEAFRDAGVNRMSIGVQALDDDALVMLGRRHTVREALDALENARSVFDRVSLDLIYARPDQTLESWENELARLIDMHPTHVSLYQLTVEPGTPMFRDVVRGSVSLPDEDLAADLFQVTRDLLGSCGLSAYEVSNHAVEGESCRHNLTTWRGGDYMGLGPGAHGRLTTPRGPLATVALSQPDAWLAAVQANGNPTEEETLISLRERALELVMTGLRLEEGVSESRLRARTGFDFPDVLDLGGLRMAVDMGMVELGQDRLKITPEGVVFLNTLTASLLAI